MQQERESAELCLNGCGFFGAPGSGGMCSVCWKKTMSDRQAVVASPRATERKVEVAAVLETVAPTAADVIDNSMAAVKEEAVEQAPLEKLVQKNKKRCWECKKKVGLTAIECRCSHVFCNSHRFEDQHNCTFDFKTADRVELARRNPGGGEFTALVATTACDQSSADFGGSSLLSWTLLETMDEEDASVAAACSVLLGQA
ncbi:hypothetical protein CCR75_008123 [Bremia lactucae]|uniref:Uncharacterized protein n=1 Tax=Bremia lactucae TaxID=4779 RepID=A0A976IFA4_BRELC|nr:hypothetical protein CCR75_008123 [Bremia lactucae]